MLPYLEKRIFEIKLNILTGGDYFIFYMPDCSVAQSCPDIANTWTVAHQAPLSMGFSRQESWSQLPFPSPGNLPNPRIKPMSPGAPALAGRFFSTEPPVSPCYTVGPY